jgi:predicted phage terminase large subunit-like protein
MPNASAGRDAPFPVDDNYPKFIPRKDFNQNVPIAYRELCIDTAETVNARSNYSSICVAAWSGNGKCYIDEIIHGKYLPDKLVKLIISTFLKYNKPHCPVSAIKIEETGFVRGLSATFGRYQDLNGINLPIAYIKRDTTISKNERILNTLQPWYKSGDLVFLEDIECKAHMLSELEQFPLSATDDILDSVADVFQGKTWFGRETTRDNESRKGIDRRAHEIQQTFARLQDYHFKQFTNQGGMEWTTPGDPMDSVNPDNYRY